MANNSNKWLPVSEDCTMIEPAAVANEARKTLAKSPVCRPRKIDRDREYGSFFGQHRINNNYSTYRAPPGTQHYVHQSEFSDL